MEVIDSKAKQIATIHQSIVNKVENFVPAEQKSDSDVWTRTSYIKSNFPSWQYNGVAPFEDVKLWCEQTFGNDWIWSFETIFFKYEKDRTVFLMKWS